jgi:hypothetical protein
MDMKKKTSLNRFYTLVTMNSLEKVDYIPNEEDEIMLWEEHYITIQLINMTITINIIGHESQANDVCQYQLKNYVDMLKSHCHYEKIAYVETTLIYNYITIVCNIGK